MSKLIISNRPTPIVFTTKRQRKDFKDLKLLHTLRMIYNSTFTQVNRLYNTYVILW